ncbi:unnamed protein product [Tilletia laevis]|nr:hypothetical protein CF336_g6964 [Tilletia laevis]KAE8188579.1 hypothetical protein CF328_g6556 [Tilletia controversa]KAE8190489.1 hypothetical protein CF335_g6343 [Tilletia laevis]CAD6941752.1 unnamed protein product [Tilletia laevis]
MGTSGTAWRTPVRDMLSLQRVDPLDGSQSDASDSRTPEILLDCSLDIDAWIERTLFELASRGEGASGTGGLDKSSKGKKKGGQQHHHGKTVVTCEDAEMAVTEDARLLLAAFSVFGSTGQQARKEDEDDRSGRVRPSSSQTDISESPSTTTAKDDIKPDQEVQQQNQDLAHPLRRALDANPGLRERVRRAARRLAMLDPSLWAISASGTSASDGHLSDVDGKRLELWNDGRRMESLSDVSHAKGTIGIRLVPLLS